MQHILQILCQQFKASRPHRQLAGGDVIQGAQGSAAARAGEGLQKYGTACLQLQKKAVRVQHVIG